MRAAVLEVLFEVGQSVGIALQRFHSCLPVGGPLLCWRCSDLIQRRDN